MNISKAFRETHSTMLVAKCFPSHKPRFHPTTVNVSGLVCGSHHLVAVSTTRQLQPQLLFIANCTLHKHIFYSAATFL